MRKIFVIVSLWCIPINASFTKRIAQLLTHPDFTNSYLGHYHRGHTLYKIQLNSIKDHATRAIYPAFNEQQRKESLFQKINEEYGGDNLSLQTVMRDYVLYYQSVLKSIKQLQTAQLLGATSKIAPLTESELEEFNVVTTILLQNQESKRQNIIKIVEMITAHEAWDLGSEQEIKVESKSLSHQAR